MPISLYLDGHSFDPDIKRVMGLAFEMALVALRVTHRGDPAAEMLAKRIIALAKDGVTDPDQLCDEALSDLRARRREV
jgi:hypothetical protein